MKKINSGSTTKQITEIGMTIIELNKKASIANDAFFDTTFALLSEKTGKLVDAINRGRIKNEKKELDDIRCLDAKAIFYTVNASCIRRSGEDRDQALRLKKILDRYSLKIIAYSFSNKSANIRAMLIDLKDESVKEARSSVPYLDQLIANLEESQRNFDGCETKLIEELVERSKSKSASILARELKDIIDNHFCIYIEAMALVEPEKYTTYCGLLKTIIIENNRQVEEHKTALKRKKEKTEVAG